MWTKCFLSNFPAIRRARALDIDHTKITDIPYLLDTPYFSLESCNFETDQFINNEVFDLGICTEVLEHISMDSALLVLEQLAQSRRLLIFSAAVKGQGGTNHINEQSLEYWISLLKQFGFSPLDIFRTKLNATNKGIPDYYANNLVLWVNTNLAGVNLIDFESLVEGKYLAVWDTRSLMLRIRHGFLSLFPIKIITLLSKLKGASHFLWNSRT